MANIFVSYNRHSETVVRGVVEDVEALGHVVWFDQELTGGQTWWDQILARIRACDLFVFVLDPASLESTACTREYTYAAQLGKTILPLLIADGVSVGLLPDELSRVQYVDVRKADRAATLRLARALTGISPAGPLPDPLPVPPDVPLSYLASLGRLVDGVAPLTYEQQSGLLIDLRKALRDPGTRDDARVLMERLRRRRDLLAAIADEMREMWAEIPARTQAPPVTPTSVATPVAAPVQAPALARTQPVATAVVDAVAGGVAVAVNDPSAPSTARSLAPWRTTVGVRVRNAVIGGIVGTATGIAALQTARNSPWELGLLTGVGVGAAAAIAGPHRRTVFVAAMCAVIAWIGFIVILRWSGDTSDDLIAAGGVFFAPIGCVVGAIGDVVVGKIRRRRLHTAPEGSPQPL